MNIPERFLQHWKQQFIHLPVTQTHVILAVSGGVDSVVLAHLLNKAAISFSIAHCNFELRGEESERDEVFVRGLAATYGVDVQVNRFDTTAYAQQHKIAIQEAARMLRYQWFEQLQQQSPHKPAVVATAHHANDNIETLLMNFFRGTGISGLHGIQPVQHQLIRPLLFATREEISAYALEQQLSWVEDSSNASDKYTRNYFRLQLIPALKKVFPGVEENLQQNITRFNEVELLYRQAVTAQLEKLVEPKGNEWHIPVYKLLKTAAMHTLLWEVMRPLAFSAAQVEEVKKLIHSGHNGSYVASATHRIIKNRNWLVMAPVQAQQAQHVIIDVEMTEVLFKEGVLQVSIEEAVPAAEIQQSANIALLDADEIHFPLILRPWKQGDYFYPLGMQKKKKLSRFLIDQKLSATEKEKVWVIETNHKMIWVAGRRIDDRFKIKPHTKNVLRLTWLPATT